MANQLLTIFSQCKYSAYGLMRILESEFTHKEFLIITPFTTVTSFNENVEIGKLVNGYIKEGFEVDVIKITLKQSINRTVEILSENLNRSSNVIEYCRMSGILKVVDRKSLKSILYENGANKKKRQTCLKSNHEYMRISYQPININIIKRATIVVIS